MDIWTAKAESGLTLARDSRSVERTKKLPWNVWMDRPEGDRGQLLKHILGIPPQNKACLPFVHLILMTASKPIFLVR